MILNIPDDIIINSLKDKTNIIKFKYKEEDYNIPLKELISMIITFKKDKVFDYIIKNNILQLDNIDIDGRTILYNIIKFNYFDYLKQIIEYDKKQMGISITKLKDKKQNTSLIYTIIFNRFEMFTFMIDNGFNPYDVNFQGINSFHLALKLKKNIFLDYLFKKYEDFTFLNKNGESFIYLILQEENLKYFPLVLKKKIDINLSEFEYNISPIIITIVNNMTEQFNTLINCPKINLEKTDKYGNNILHYAILENNYDMIILIIQKLSTFNYQNLNGLTPFHMIITNNELFNKIYQNNKNEFNKLVDNTNFNLIENEGMSVAFSLIKSGINDITIDILKRKKINPLISNLEGIDIIDMIKNDETVLNIFIEKYYQSLSKSELEDLENWEKHCLNKNYKTLENDYNIKKYTKDLKDEKKCMEIIKRKLLLKEKYRAIDKKKNIKIDTGIVVENCYYTGSSIDVIFGLIYLNNNLNSIDIMIEYPLTENKELEEYYSKMNIDYPYKLDFSNFEINWIPVAIFYPTYFDKKLEKYNDSNYRKTNRFIVIPVSIELSNGSSHANIIIIDNMMKNISRFEPHGGIGPDGFYFNEKLLDMNLMNKFKNIFNDYKYFKPSDYLPNIGFQSLENLMSEQCKKIGDPNGFCAVWCIWWVYQRIKYNHLDIKTLSEKLINQLKIDKIDIPDMIRNFSTNISKLRDDILKQNNIDINDWINTNYDNNILDSIEKDTFNLIK